jgi:hypothetical protein
MITIHQICFNEIVILEFAFNFYKSRFPNAKFVLHDNGSTDGSVELAQKLGYEIIPFDTGNQMDDATMMNLKNNCWRDDTTDWVLVADMDELIDINETKLLWQKSLGANIITTYGYNMVNTTNELKLENITSGFRDDTFYDKSLIFNKKFVHNMDWAVGSHTCTPNGENISFSTDRFTLLHYKYLGEDYIVDRYRLLKNRQCQNNINNNWSWHYNIHEQELRNFFKYAQNRELTRLL